MGRDSEGGEGDEGVVDSESSMGAFGDVFECSEATCALFADESVSTEDGTLVEVIDAFEGLVALGGAL